MHEGVIYFELNNWTPGKDYPAAEPFLSWMINDLAIKFEDREWVKENELCVVAQPIDMSVNFCITAKKEWVEKNCPELLTKYKEFLRFPDIDEDGVEDDYVLGKWGTMFLEYEAENFGVHWKNEDGYDEECDDEEYDEDEEAE